MNRYLNEHFENEFNHREVTNDDDDQSYHQQLTKPKVIQLSFINFPELKYNNHDFGYLDMENESLDFEVVK